MKTLVILVIILVLVGCGWWWLSQARLKIGFLEGKLAVVSRGDLTIPITATGEIQPKARSEIKPEASGAIKEIVHKAGDMVRKGDLIIRLDPDEEQRSVTRSQNDLDRAKAMLRQQELNLEERRTTNLAGIDARLAAIKAQMTEAEYRYKKTKDLYEHEQSSEDEWIQIQSRWNQMLAQRDQLQAERRQADIAVELAEQEVILARKASETAETNLRDAEKRHRDTTIVSPIDGMISVMKAEVGEVVQEGRRNITGGTVVAVVSDVSDIYVRTEVSDADIGAVLWLAPPIARPGGEDMAAELTANDVPLNVDTTGFADRLNAEGTPVKITVDAFRDENFHGVIERIYPEPKKVQNIVTYLADIRVTSPNRKKLALVMGMQADVEFTAQSVTNAILVPHDAIRRGPSGQLGVFIPETIAGQTEPQPKFIPCRFGLDNGLYAELLEGEGVREGSQVYAQLPPKFGREEDEDKNKK